MALGKFLNGKNGLVKVGDDESVNIESWTRQRSTSTSTAPILNASVDPTIAGSIEISGTLEIYFDPDDATHVVMESGGQAVLRLYLDGDIASHYYYEGVVQFTEFSITGSASDGTLKASVSWVAQGENILQQI